MYAAGLELRYAREPAQRLLLLGLAFDLGAARKLPTALLLDSWRGEALGRDLLPERGRVRMLRAGLRGEWGLLGVERPLPLRLGLEGIEVLIVVLDSIG